MTEDNELLCRYVESRSQDAFKELVGRRIGLVYSIAFRKTLDVHRAKDVTQNVFVDLVKKAPYLCRQTVLVGWLYRTTHYTAIDLIRSEQSRAVREQKAETMQRTISDDGSEPEWETLRPLLDDVISTLDEDDRDAVLLRFFDQRSFSEIGARLQLSENTARMRVSRALEKLRSALAERGVTSTAALLSGALGAQATLAAPAGLATAIATQAGALGISAAAATGLFMNTPFILVSALALVSLGTSAYELSRAHRSESAFMDTEKERNDLRAKVAETEQRAASSEQQLAKLQSDYELARNRQASAASSVSVTKTNAVATQIADEKARLARVALEVARRRTLRLQTLDSTYRAFYQKAGFASEDIELFKTLLTENAKGSEEKLQAALAKSDNLDDAINKTNTQASIELEQKIRGAFGDPAFEAFQHYNATLPARGIADQLVANLFYTETPLILSQADKLVEIVAASLPHPQNKTVRPKSSQETIDKVIGEAQAVLSKSQLAIFREILKQQFPAPVASGRP